MVVRAFLAPTHGPRRAALPIEDAPPREHGERRSVRADEPEAVRLDRGVEDEGVPSPSRPSASRPIVRFVTKDSPSAEALLGAELRVVDSDPSVPRDVGPPGVVLLVARDDDARGGDEDAGRAHQFVLHFSGGSEARLGV